MSRPSPLKLPEIRLHDIFGWIGRQFTVSFTVLIKTRERVAGIWRQGFGEICADFGTIVGLISKHNQLICFTGLSLTHGYAYMTLKFGPGRVHFYPGGPVGRAEILPPTSECCDRQPAVTMTLPV